MTDRSSIRRRLAVVISLVGVAVVVAVAALARTERARQVATAVGVHDGEAPFTALSFATPADLGSAGVVYDGTTVHDRVRFEVANRENRDVRYRWTISFSPAGRRYRGVLRLASGATGQVTREVELPCGTPIDSTVVRPGGSIHRARVHVDLAPVAESIDYWQSCGG